MTDKERAERFLREAARLMTPIDGWTMFVESSGGWCWSLPPELAGNEHGLALYASPFWEDLAGIPVEFCLNDHNEASVSAFVPFTPTDDLQADAERYRALIRPYLALRPMQTALGNGLPTLNGDDDPGAHFVHGDNVGAAFARLGWLNKG